MKSIEALQRGWECIVDILYSIISPVSWIFSLQNYHLQPFRRRSRVPLIDSLIINRSRARRVQRQNTRSNYSQLGNARRRHQKKDPPPSHSAGQHNRYHHLNNPNINQYFHDFRTPWQPVAHYSTASTTSFAMDDGVQLRDEAAQDRVRAAVEFLDPSMLLSLVLIPARISLTGNCDSRC